MWHVLLKFPNINVKMSLPSVSERTKLMNLISDFVEFRSLDDPSDPFQMYRSVSYGGLSLYLKSEAAPGHLTSRRFYPLDMRRSLKTCLRDTVIVEHPIIYVVFKSDEHLFREEADDIHMEVKEEVAAPASEPLGVGDVMSQTEAMQADPEAYKKYFDFYLKYYTSKYAQHGVGPEDTAPPPASVPFSAMAGTVNTNTFPSRAPPHQPTPLQPLISSISRTAQLNRNSLPRAPSNVARTNTSNQEHAKTIRQELQKEKPVSLTGLVAYDDSDSD